MDHSHIRCVQFNQRIKITSTVDDRRSFTNNLARTEKMCNIEIQQEKNRMNNNTNDFEMIFSPFAYRHRLYFSFHFISPLRGRFSFFGLSHILISKWMLWFNFSLHVAYFSHCLSSLSLLRCSAFCVWRWWVSIIFQFKKETLIISLAVFSCSSCATENTRTHIVYTGTGTHIKFIAIWCLSGLRTWDRKRKQRVRCHAMPLTQAAMIIRNRKRNREEN